MNDNNNNTGFGENPTPSAAPSVQQPMQPPVQQPVQPPANFGSPTPPPMNYGSPYGQVPYMQENLQPANSSDGLAVASMILGICAIILSCCFGIGQLLAVISIILGIIALVKKTRKKGMSIAGIIMSGVTLLLALAALFFFMINPQAVEDFTREFENEFSQRYYEEYNDYDDYYDEYFLD